MGRRAFVGSVSGAVSSTACGVPRDLKLSVPERSFVTISSPTQLRPNDITARLVPQAITPLCDHHRYKPCCITAKPGWFGRGETAEHVLPLSENLFFSLIQSTNRQSYV